jgi:hypothetical protein
MILASDTWADHLRFVPWIEDGEGNLFNEAFQLSKNLDRQFPDGAGFTAPVDPFHTTGVGDV